MFGFYTDQYKLGVEINQNKLTKQQYHELIQSKLYYCHPITTNQINIYLHLDSTTVDQLHALYDAIQIYNKQSINTNYSFHKFVTSAQKLGWRLDLSLIRLESGNYRYSTTDSNSDVVSTANDSSTTPTIT